MGAYELHGKRNLRHQTCVTAPGTVPPQLVCFYYVLTTFTTVGYGKNNLEDLSPKPCQGIQSDLFLIADGRSSDS
jgi:hypothetical protein